MKFIAIIVATILGAQNPAPAPGSQDPPIPGPPIPLKLQPTTRPSALVPVEELQKRLDAKLQSEFLKKLPWLTEYEKAVEESKKSGKLVFAYFTRSDVDYAACRIMETGALLEPAFADFAKDYVLFCHVTTQIKDRKGENLLREKNGAGYPSIMFLDENGNTVFRHNGVRTVEAFAASGKSAAVFYELQKRAANGDAAAKVELILKQVDASVVHTTQAAMQLKDLKGLPAELQKKAGEIVFEAEIEELYRSSINKEQETAAAAQKVLEWYDNKRIPERERAQSFYFGILLQYGRQRKDAKIFELAIVEQEKIWAGDPKRKNNVLSLRNELDHIKKTVRAGELKTKADAGDKSVAKELLLLQLDLQQITFDDATAKIKEVGEFSAEERAKLDDYMSDLEVRDLTGSVRSKETMIAAGKRALKMVEEKRIPQRLDAYQRFWVFIINYAANSGDEEALKTSSANIREKMAKLSDRPEEQQQLQPILLMAERRYDETVRKNHPNAPPASQPEKK
ncbi:MAG: hypothetical protein HY286_08955 [Planctomycetes bacterium]|nr:hypothetical protein [Planctomycetota bacterium]